MSANSSTIKFNVGGRHFEVSRDLIDTHSETMLRKLVSDAWQEDPRRRCLSIVTVISLLMSLTIFGMGGETRDELSIVIVPGILTRFIHS